MGKTLQNSQFWPILDHQKLIKRLEANKANLRDLIAATDLVILLQFDSNHWLISLCDLEIWWMTSKNNKAPLLYYIKLYASFQIHRWIQTGVTVPKCSMPVKIADFVVPHDLEIWWMTLKNIRAPLPYYIKLCAAFQSHWYIQTEVTVRKRTIWVKIGDFFVSCDKKIGGWPWKNNRAPLLCYFKLCASFYSHWWIQTGVTVWKRPIRVKIDNFFSRVTLKFDG